MPEKKENNSPWLDDDGNIITLIDVFKACLLGAQALMSDVMFNERIKNSNHLKRIYKRSANILGVVGNSFKNADREIKKKETKPKLIIPKNKLN